MSQVFLLAKPYICFFTWLFFLPYHYLTACSQTFLTVAFIKVQYWKLVLGSWEWLLVLTPWRRQFWYRYLNLWSQNTSRKNDPLENAESGKCVWQVYHSPAPASTTSSSSPPPLPLTCAQTVWISWMMAVLSVADEGLHCTDCAWGGRNENQNVASWSQP